MSDREKRSLTPFLPTYAQARWYLRLVDGEPDAVCRGLIRHVMEQRGTPQDQEDWTKPERWIPERLTGDERDLALNLWRESDGVVNPRYLRGCLALSNRHALLEADMSGILRLTERGTLFVAEPQGQVVAEMDAYEGLLHILHTVAERGPGKRGDILPQYAEYCRTYTSYKSESVIRGSLYDRLMNLIDRDLVVRSYQTYEVTDKGLAYLERHADLIVGRRQAEGQSQLRRLAKEASNKARAELIEFLSAMNPYAFERLVQFLLEEMGYVDVQVTAPANDKGVDVVGRIELGITSVREVVQVKRHRSNINRTVLDQLRGSLHRFNALRGTIITTGGFSRGAEQAAFEPGAAPITLIDGEKLLDLLVEHSIGVSKQSIDYVEFDPDSLAVLEDDVEEE